MTDRGTRLGRENVITRLLIVATALAFASTGAADAASRHKHKIVRHHARHHPAHIVPVAPVDPYLAFYNRGPKPPWGAPQQCFTDEGYGRYWPCGAGPSNMP